MPAVAQIPKKQDPYNPSFSDPAVQTAPDVRQSAGVVGNLPTPPAPNPATAVGSPVSIPQAAAAPAAPTLPASAPAAAPSPTVASVPAATGAPPGLPNTTPAIPAAPPAVSTPALPPTMRGLEGKNAAENDYIRAQNEQAQKVYEAALKYSGGPASELEGNRVAAENALRTATGNRGAAGTIESSLFGGDKSRIATAQATANLKSYETYQKSVSEANNALEAARVAYQRADEAEKREIAEAAQKRAAEQQAQNNTSGLQYPNPQFPNLGVTPAEARGGVMPYEKSVPGQGWVRVGRRR